MKEKERLVVVHLHEQMIWLSDITEKLFTLYATILDLLHFFKTELGSNLKCKFELN